MIQKTHSLYQIGLRTTNHRLLFPFTENFTALFFIIQSDLSEAHRERLVCFIITSRSSSRIGTMTFPVLLLVESKIQTFVRPPRIAPFGLSSLVSLTEKQVFGLKTMTTTKKVSCRLKEKKKKSHGALMRTNVLPFVVFQVDAWRTDLEVIKEEKAEVKVENVEDSDSILGQAIKAAVRRPMWPKNTIRFFQRHHQAAAHVKATAH